MAFTSQARAHELRTFRSDRDRIQILQDELSTQSAPLSVSDSDEDLYDEMGRRRAWIPLNLTTPADPSPTAGPPIQTFPSVSDVNSDVSSHVPGQPDPGRLRSMSHLVVRRRRSESKIALLVNATQKRQAKSDEDENLLDEFIDLGPPRQPSPFPSDQSHMSTQSLQPEPRWMQPQRSSTAAFSGLSAPKPPSYYPAVKGTSTDYMHRTNEVYAARHNSGQRTSTDHLRRPGNMHTAHCDMHAARGVYPQDTSTEYRNCSTEVESGPGRPSLGTPSGNFDGSSASYSTQHALLPANPRPPIPRLRIPLPEFTFTNPTTSDSGQLLTPSDAGLQPRASNPHPNLPNSSALYWQEGTEVLSGGNSDLSIPPIGSSDRFSKGKGKMTLSAPDSANWNDTGMAPFRRIPSDPYDSQSNRSHGEDSYSVVFPTPESPNVLPCFVSPTLSERETANKEALLNEHRAGVSPRDNVLYQDKRFSNEIHGAVSRAMGHGVYPITGTRPAPFAAAGQRRAPFNGVIFSSSSPDGSFEKQEQDASDSVLHHILLPAMATMKSYSMGEGGYFNPFKKAPDWTIDHSAAGRESYFGEDWGAPPQRVGRDPRYRAMHQDSRGREDHGSLADGFQHLHTPIRQQRGPPSLRAYPDHSTGSSSSQYSGQRSAMRGDMGAADSHFGDYSRRSRR